MAVFTAVTEAQLARWLTHYPLGDLVDFCGIQPGIENSNFFLTTTRGEYVLTIFERLTAGELPFYLDLMRHLAHHSVPVPNPVPRNDGALFAELHGKPAALVTKLAGHVQCAPNQQHCLEIGQLLARLHLAGRDFPHWQPNLRSLPWWRSVAPQLTPFLDDAQAKLLITELAVQQAFFTSADYALLPGGPCHCDLFRDNALFVPARMGAQETDETLSGLFDFYFAGCDKWLFDVAVTVNDWCIDLPTGRLDAARCQALLRAYQTVRPFTAVERYHWRDMLRASALRFWISRLYDRYLPRAAQLLNPRDPAHFERILRERIDADHPLWF